MSDYTVNIRHTGGLSFEQSNGRTALTSDWNPEAGSWLATELFLAGLGSCMLATMMDYAQTNNVDIEGAGVEISAESETRPMRMSRIHVTYQLPAGLGDDQVAALVRAGNRCKVHHTIEHHPEMVIHTETGVPTA